MLSQYCSAFDLLRADAHIPAGARRPGEKAEGVRYYVRVDRVNYSDGFHPGGLDPWSTEPDGYGKSLTRKVPADYGNEPLNWIAAAPSPGE